MCFENGFSAANKRPSRPAARLRTLETQLSPPYTALIELIPSRDCHCFESFLLTLPLSLSLSFLALALALALALMFRCLLTTVLFVHGQEQRGQQVHKEPGLVSASTSFTLEAPYRMRRNMAAIASLAATTAFGSAYASASATKQARID